MGIYGVSELHAFDLHALDFMGIDQFEKVYTSKMKLVNIAAS